jgi:hypothetical protein
MAEALEKAGGRIEWPAGMQQLGDVSQKGATWSVLYSLPTRELYVSVYQHWATIHHLKAF